MNKRRITGALILLLTACIWGVAFVAQSEGMRYIGPFSFNSIRFFMGGIFLIPVVMIKDRLERRDPSQATAEEAVFARKTLIQGAICSGIILAIANSFQQFGILHTSVGKAGFITTLYIIMVPIIGILLKKKPPVMVWFSTVLAMIGLYLLCMKDNSALNLGDGYLLICAVLFSCHILVIDHFSPKVDGVKLSCLQFLISGFICMILSICFEKITWEAVWACRIPILYTGILSCGVAYTCQIIGQKYMEPAVASLILSLESVVAVIAGWLILGQVLSVKETMGCCIVFAAVILAQLPGKAEMEAKKDPAGLPDLEKTA